MADSDEDESLLSCTFCSDKMALNKALRLLIAPCGHTICEPCCGSAFRACKTLECRGCRAAAGAGGEAFVFKKEDLVPSDGEDPRVKREIRVRSRVCGIFNRQEADFHQEGKPKKQALEEFYEYLENVEAMVQKLVNRVDVERIEAELSEHENANRDQIYRNQALKRIREGQLGAAPLPWQIRPATPKWVQKAADNDKVKGKDRAAAGRGAAVEAGGARRLAADAKGGGQMREKDMTAQLEKQRGETKSAKSQEGDFAQYTTAGDVEKDPKRARVAGGHKDEYRAKRDMQAAMLGISAALRSRMAVV